MLVFETILKEQQKIDCYPTQVLLIRNGISNNQSMNAVNSPKYRWKASIVKTISNNVSGIMIALVILRIYVKYLITFILPLRYSPTHNLSLLSKLNPNGVSSSQLSTHRRNLPFTSKICRQSLLMSETIM